MRPELEGKILGSTIKIRLKKRIKMNSKEL